VVKVLLNLENVSKEFSRGTIKITAVNNVSFTLNHNDFVSIIGSSGSGKSTLLSIMAGLQKPDLGNVKINDIQINTLSDKELSALRNSLIGYVPQGESLLNDLNVVDNIRLPYSLYHRDNDIDGRIDELLDNLGISSLKNSYPSGLSGGERKRVVIARALINNPQLLLADEPTSDLDAKNTAKIVEIFKKVAQQGTAIIMVTHNLETLDSESKVYEMKKGILKLK
jgi:putative ABC transport system ATP-binding protein